MDKDFNHDQLNLKLFLKRLKMHVSRKYLFITAMDYSTKKEN